MPRANRNVPRLDAVTERARESRFGFGATVNDTVAGKVPPLWPAVMVTSSSGFTAYEHDEPVVLIVNVPLPPFAGIVRIVGEVVNGHGFAGCESATLTPPIVSTPGLGRGTPS